MLTNRHPVIELENLTKHYGDIVGIQDLSLEVNDGEVFGLLGPNGAGKTTTIRLILDFIRTHIWKRVGIRTISEI